MRVVAALLTVLTLTCARSASADPFTVGEFVTFSHAGFGDLDSDAGQLLLSEFFNVYASTGLVEIGLSGAAGFSARFTSPLAIAAYLPATGTPGPLIADLIDPTVTASGSFGGEVLTLTLNRDFAALTGGTSTVLFGDLILANFANALLNGLTVDQFVDIANIGLGGGSTFPFTITDLVVVSVGLNNAFEGGNPSAFAEEHLLLPSTPPTPIPEPSTFLLVGLGAVGLRKLRRRTHQ